MPDILILKNSNLAIIALNECSFLIQFVFAIVTEIYGIFI